MLWLLLSARERCDTQGVRDKRPGDVPLRQPGKSEQTQLLRRGGCRRLRKIFNKKAENEGRVPDQSDNY